MENDSVISSTLLAGIIGGLTTGVFYATRLLIWKGDVPLTISRVRWIIAGFFAILLLFVEIELLGSNGGKTQILINGGVFMGIANALRAEPKTK